MTDNIRRYVKLGALILVGIVCIWVLYLAKDVLWPFALAVLLVYLLSPLVDYLEERKLPRVLATLLVYLLLLLIFILVILVIIPGVVNTFEEISTKLPGYVDRIAKYMGFIERQYTKLGLPWEWKELTNQIVQGIENLIRQGVSNIAGIFSGIFLFILSLIVSFYLLKDARQIRQALINYMPASYRSQISEFLTDVDRILGGYIRGQLLVAIVVGACIGTGLFLLGIKYAFVLGVIAGIFNVIPYLGPVIAIIPAFFLTLLRDPFSAWVFLWIILLFIGVNQAEALFLSPHILGREVRLHPVAVIFAIIIGGAALGMIGVLLAIPALAVIKAFFLRFYREQGEYKEGEE